MHFHTTLTSWHSSAFLRRLHLCTVHSTSTAGHRFGFDLESRLALVSAVITFFWSVTFHRPAMRVDDLLRARPSTVNFGRLTIVEFECVQALCMDGTISRSPDDVGQECLEVVEVADLRMLEFSEWRQWYGIAKFLWVAFAG